MGYILILGLEKDPARKEGEIQIVKRRIVRVVLFRSLNEALW